MRVLQRDSLALTSRLAPAQGASAGSRADHITDSHKIGINLVLLVVLMDRHLLASVSELNRRLRC